MTASRSSAPLTMSVIARRPARVVAADAAESGRTRGDRLRGDDDVQAADPGVRQAGEVDRFRVRVAELPPDLGQQLRLHGVDLLVHPALHVEQVVGDALRHLEHPVGREVVVVRHRVRLLRRLGAGSIPLRERGRRRGGAPTASSGAVKVWS